MSLSDEQQEFLLDFCLLVQFARRLGFKVTPGELKRTIEQQQIYFDTGRSRTMHSMHLLGLAGDLNIFKNGDYLLSYGPITAMEMIIPLGVFWESLHKNNVWGGNFDKDFSRKDPWIDVPHFQRNR